MYRKNIRQFIKILDKLIYDNANKFEEEVSKLIQDKNLSLEDKKEKINIMYNRFISKPKDYIEGFKRDEETYEQHGITYISESYSIYHFLDAYFETKNIFPKIKNSFLLSLNV